MATDPTAIIEGAAREIIQEADDERALTAAKQTWRHGTGSFDEVYAQTWLAILTPILTRMAEAYHETRAGELRKALLADADTLDRQADDSEYCTLTLRHWAEVLRSRAGIDNDHPA
jgi:hypothetical protein